MRSFSTSTSFSMRCTAYGVSALAALFALLASALLSACGGPSVHEDGLTWRDKPMRIAVHRTVLGADSLRAWGWAALIDQPPERILQMEPGEWGDSLWLLEYKDELKSYTAFQELSVDDEGIALGLTVCGDRVCFRRGRWIGAVDAWSWKGGTWFDQALALPDAPVAGGIPEVFGSLLHQNRFEGTERVLIGSFMGQPLKTPVYAMKADCRGDTAWVYAAPRLGLEFANSLSRQPGWTLDTLRGLKRGVELTSRIQELPPVILQFLRGGMVGVEGCFDKDLTHYWLKMQSRGLKSLK